jgi:hypothetical protein
MDNDKHLYRTFEEFEREELRRADAGDGRGSYDWDGYFGEEPDFGAFKRPQSVWDDDLEQG